MSKVHPSQLHRSAEPHGSGQHITETAVFDNRATVNLAVLGNSRVGKTSFIQNALNLEKPPLNLSSSKKVSLGGVIHRVALYEVDLRRVEVLDNQRVNWPETVGNVALPAVDAALCLYDITDEESIIGISQILRKSLRHTSCTHLPFVLKQVYSEVLADSIQQMSWRDLARLPSL